MSESRLEYHKNTAKQKSNDNFFLILKITADSLWSITGV